MNSNIPQVDVIIPYIPAPITFKSGHSVSVVETVQPVQPVQPVDSVSVAQPVVSVVQPAQPVQCCPICSTCLVCPTCSFSEPVAHPVHSDGLIQPAIEILDFSNNEYEPSDPEESDSEPSDSEEFDFEPNHHPEESDSEPMNDGKEEKEDDEEEIDLTPSNVKRLIFAGTVFEKISQPTRSYSST